MRIITTGSRDWPTDEFSNLIITSTMYGLWHANCYSREALTVVHGHCPTGADAVVDKWATDMEDWAKKSEFTLPGTLVIPERHPADWDTHGKAAGPIRNTEMAAHGADLCVAFLFEPDGRLSKGTRNMMNEAYLESIHTLEIPWRS